jgi:hypothetical protein
VKTKLLDRLKWAGKRIQDARIEIKNTVLGLGGIASINTAVWINSITWGLVATGVSLLVLQHLTETERR